MVAPLEKPINKGVLPMISFINDSNELESMQKCGAITLKQQVGAGLQMDEHSLAYRHPTLLHALN
jgi:hypothetical protein